MVEITKNRGAGARVERPSIVDGFPSNESHQAQIFNKDLSIE